VVLDMGSETTLKSLFGDAQYDKIPERTRQTAMSYWQDTIKPNFEEQDDKDLEVDYFISMPGVDNNISIGLENGFLAIDGLVTCIYCFSQIANDNRQSYRTRHF
jgi:hypothetical protein